VRGGVNTKTNKEPSRDTTVKIATCKGADRKAAIQMAIATNFKEEDFEIELTYLRA
jgi:hypothetical protein